MGRETFTSDAARLFIRRLLRALRARPMVRAEIEQELFASKTKAINYLRFLHGRTGAKKRIYIASYDDLPTGGRNPRYAYGRLEDADPLGVRSMSERWERIKSDPKKHAAYKERLRKAARKKGIQPRKKPKPDLWLAALKNMGA